jgi:Tol biopolymer transport system component
MPHRLTVPKWGKPALLAVTIGVLLYLLAPMVIARMGNHPFHGVGGLQAFQQPTGTIYFLSSRDYHQDGVPETEYDYNVEIYRMKADGGTQKRVTSFFSTHDWGGDVTTINGFDVHPDGTYLAVSKGMAASAADEKGEIYLVNTDDGTVIRPLTNLDEYVHRRTGSYFVGYRAPWSPQYSRDGRAITFAMALRTKWHEGKPYYSKTETGFWTVPAAGGAISEIQVDAANRAFRGDTLPVVSPDGTTIIFAASKIWVMHADGTNLRQLTEGEGQDCNPNYTPDGKYIIFASDRGGNYDIYRMRADGSDITQLTNAVAFDGQPAISPDGDYIAFVSGRDGSPEIYRMTIDGTDQQRLTTNNDMDACPRWSR